MAEERLEDDDWVPVPELVTNEQVAAMNALLAMPWVERDIAIFADDETPSTLTSTGDEDG